MVLLIPAHGERRAPSKVEMGMITQLVHRGLYVATPVALAQNIVIIIVERRHPTGNVAPILAHLRDDTQHPHGRLYLDTERSAQLLIDVIAEVATLVDIAIAQEILASVHAMVEGQENGLHHIFHINESDVLPTEAHREIHMALHALRHQEIVGLTRAIDARGAQHYVGEIAAEGVEIVLCLELAAAIGGVGTGQIVLIYLLIRLPLLDSAKHTEAADEEKKPDGHFQSTDGGEIGRA